MLRKLKKQIVILREYYGKTRKERTAKGSTYRSYFKTYAEAYRYGLVKENLSIESAEKRLEYAKESKLKFINANPEPEVE